jgi:hypothetical protein
MSYACCHCGALGTAAVWSVPPLPAAAGRCSQAAPPAPCCGLCGCALLFAGCCFFFFLRFLLPAWPPLPAGVGSAAAGAPVLPPCWSCWRPALPNASGRPNADSSCPRSSTCSRCRCRQQCVSGQWAALAALAQSPVLCGHLVLRRARRPGRLSPAPQGTKGDGSEGVSARAHQHRHSKRRGVHRARRNAPDQAHVALANGGDLQAGQVVHSPISQGDVQRSPHLRHQQLRGIVDAARHRSWPGWRGGGRQG